MRALVALGILTLGASMAACGPGDSQRLLRDAVDAKQPSLTSCYASALARDESIAGLVRARLHVDRSTGAVRQAEIIESEVTDETLLACMTGALEGVRLADTPKVNLTVDYDFQLVPDGSGSGRVVEQ
ncbi:MAG: AgmX/PglI C-terminal domain-containing protein [Polyangiaceae bacterium]|nr:AgmX/PglI C-terminal domain-containing protein [Polyangiaceae bacterium]